MGHIDTRPDVVDRSIIALLALFSLERLVKLGTIMHFFSQPSSPKPDNWPTITIIQPITRGASGLRKNLQSRAGLEYPGKVQHVLICDIQDKETQVICREYLTANAYLQADLVRVESGPDKGPASKIEKMLAALPYATGEVLCFLDDDIALRSDALRTLLPPLERTGVGAVFGLACYTNWDTTWSSVMSLFVNAHALLSYIPLTYLTEPFTLTGHCFALKRTTFEQAGGFTHLAGRIDDDHEIARRVRKLGLHCQQSPLIYDVDNALPSLQAYLLQMKRWFVLPRQTMLPSLSFYEQLVSLTGSYGNLLPGILMLCALLTRRKSAIWSVGICLTLYSAIYFFCERRYLQRPTPRKRWLLLPLVAILTPFHALAALLMNNEIEWRGQRLRVEQGGEIILIPNIRKEFQ